MDRIGPEAVIGIPAAGALMQLRLGVRRFNSQAMLQQIGEEAVIAIPLARRIERDDEEIGVLQRRQQGAAVTPIGHGITQGRREPIEDGGLQQEVLHVGRLALKDFVDEVIQNIAIAAGKRLNQLPGVGVTAQRQGQQLQPGDPALGALLQRGDIAPIQFQPRGLPQKIGRFFQRELQIGLANLRHLTARAQARERQRRILAREDDHAQSAAVDDPAGKPVVDEPAASR